MLLLGLLGAASAGAQTPRVAAFLQRDSLAVAVDCEPMFVKECRERLHEGYPLSFALDLSLRRHDPIWIDRELIARRAGFRVTHEPWEARYRCAIRDFGGRATELVSPRLEDLLLQIEDRLSIALAAAADLDAEAKYFISVTVEYRSLTLEDVRSTEDWLRGGAEHDSASARNGRPLGTSVLRLLWDLAGLKGERREVATPMFRLRQLRRLDPTP
jgi:hypothetical protein